MPFTGRSTGSLTGSSTGKSDERESPSLRRRRARVWAASIAIATLGAGISYQFAGARPGVLRTKDGLSFAGDITEGGRFDTIIEKGVSTQIDVRNVARVEYGDFQADSHAASGGSENAAPAAEAIQDEYNARHAKLAPNDALGRAGLAVWANSMGRADLAVQALEEAQKLAPTNRAVALQLADTRQQLQLDRSGGIKSPGPSTQPSAVAAGAGANAAASAAQRPASPSDDTTGTAAPFRLLDDEEINLIRQHEVPQLDPKVRVGFDHDVVLKYLAATGMKQSAFRQLSPLAQAQTILAMNDPKMSRDVRILNDPIPLADFRKKVYPILVAGCATSGCHGGTAGGDFRFFTGDSAAAVYTNFYILQTYAKTVNQTQYLMTDRNYPSRSLCLMFGLPASITAVPHPASAEFRPKFRNMQDAGYQTILDYVTNDLRPFEPTYGINVSPYAPVATASTPTAPPATRPATP